MNTNKPSSSTLQESPKSPIARFGLLAAGVLSFCLIASVATADDRYYGTVESFGDGLIVVKTTKHSTGHWKIVPSTKIGGSSSIKVGDFVSVELEGSGRVKDLTFEERPTSHSGVIKKIHDNVLSVRSGKEVEEWNLTATTLLAGVSEKDLAVGDAVAVKLYKNHNLAELRVTKSGAK